MKFDPKIHHRRSMRLIGEVINGEMRPNELGQLAHDEWFKTAALRPYVKLYEDEFVVMPNHVHGIIWIHKNDGGEIAAIVGTERRSVPTKLLGAIVRAYKSAVTYAVNALQNQRGAVLWQRNYYEHVIRDEKDLQAKRDYILSNPLDWEDDDENIKWQK